MSLDNIANTGVNLVGSLAVIGITANLANNIVKSSKTPKKYRLKF